GASKGLGFACAKALAGHGVHVILVARTLHHLDQAVEDINEHNALNQLTNQVIGIAQDVTSEEGREAIWQQILSLGQSIDILVTNAGGPPPGDFLDWSLEDWQKALLANMLTPIEWMKKMLPVMTQQGFGRVVNITSSAVKSPIDVLGLSNGARSGLTGFVAGLARQSKYASNNVTINNLLPGAFATDRLKNMLAHQAQTHHKSAEEMMLMRTQQIPARRLGNPDEFGATCAFLCSQHASYITGQNILIDGGAYTGTL
ncbi:MAG: SDR family oxidoreductase, partial [Gammaproteobacteria bacterium]|nr:SDR family oxidoreductase [Gammaproteobacteria bacterium]